jgi:hypothetical protein
MQLARGAKTARWVGFFCIIFGTLALVPVISEFQRKPPLVFAIAVAATAGVLLVPGLIYFFLAAAIKEGRRWAAVVVFAGASIHAVLLGISLVRNLAADAAVGTLLLGMLLAVLTLLLAVEGGRCMSAASTIARAAGG